MAKPKSRGPRKIDNKLRWWQKTMILLYATLLFVTLVLCGCSSTTPGDEVAHQANKNIYLDSAVTFGIDGLPIPIPKITFGVKFNFERLTPEEKVDIDLAKNGKFRKPEDRPNPPVIGGPKPTKLEK